MRKRKFLAVLLACACVCAMSAISACTDKKPEISTDTESVDGDPAMEDIYD